jgi:hypothetical protein
MGHTIWVDLRGRAKGVALQDNSIMLRLQSQLDDLSTKLNVPNLSEFYDYSELEAAYGELDGEDDEVEGGDPTAEDGQDEGDWFNPGPALAAVQVIHDHLVKHPEGLGFEADPSRSHWPGDLMEELAHCQAVLKGAVARGQEFRFLIVP